MGEEEDAATTFEPRNKMLKKPPVSYIQLIVMAIESSPEKRMSLRDIYEQITINFPYFKSEESSWKVRVIFCHSDFSPLE